MTTQKKVSSPHKEVFSDGSVIYSPQGAIFLPGNKVTEHPTSGDEGGKFIFEVIPGKIKAL